VEERGAEPGDGDWERNLALKTNWIKLAGRCTVEAWKERETVNWTGGYWVLPVPLTGST
jgi:hypothetical protein